MKIWYTSLKNRLSLLPSVINKAWFCEMTHIHDSASKEDVSLLAILINISAAWIRNADKPVFSSAKGQT